MNCFFLLKDFDCHFFFHQLGHYIFCYFLRFLDRDHRNYRHCCYCSGLDGSAIFGSSRIHYYFDRCNNHLETDPIGNYHLAFVIFDFSNLNLQIDDNSHFESVVAENLDHIDSNDAD